MNWTHDWIEGDNVDEILLAGWPSMNEWRTSYGRAKLGPLRNPIAATQSGLAGRLVTRPARCPSVSFTAFYSHLLEVSLCNQMLNICSLHHKPLPLPEIDTPNFSLDDTTIAHHLDQDV